MADGESPILVSKALMDPGQHDSAKVALAGMEKANRKIVFNRLMGAIPARREKRTDAVDERNRLIRDAFASDVPLALDRVIYVLDEIEYGISHLGAYQHPIYGSCPWNIAGHASSHELPDEQKYKLINLFIALDEMIRSLPSADRRRLGKRWEHAGDYYAANAS